MPAPARTPRPLTEPERELAAANIKLAYFLAGRWATFAPHLADAFLSAAMLGLCTASARFDPTRGLPFGTFAGQCITGAMRNAIRDEWPKGYRRGERRAGAPRSRRLSKALASTDLPIGWELESEDAVNALSRSLPPKVAGAVRTFYTRADALRMKDAGRLLGVSECHVSRMLTCAREYLKRGA